MTIKGNNLNETRLEQARAENAAGLYRAPQVEVIEIELTQNILQGSGKLPDVDDGGFAW
ncbi:MAG: hypothetical protein ACOX19_01935 [Fermentimonas sp.]|jgi:hypothetical protein